MRKCFAVVMLVICSTWAFSQGDLSLTKRETKEISRLFSDEVRAEPVVLPDHSPATEKYLRVGDQLFLLKQQDGLVGYLLSTRAKGRYDYFDYSVIFSDDLVVIGLFVTVYRSTHGAAISQKKWLKQFSGYKGGHLELGKEIDAVSGGTISAQSMVDDIHRCHLLMIQLEEEGIIEK